MRRVMHLEIDVDEYRSKAPSALHSAAEFPRVLMEMTTLAYAWPVLGNRPRGDGHAVMVLPGFTAGDESTAVLRRFLRRLGYRPLPWSLGRNTGSFELQERLVNHFRSVAEDHDGRISLIGQSLGGVYARELARQFPDSVRQVITLGSPFSASGPDNTLAVVGRLFQYLSGMSHDDMREHASNVAAEAPPVPSTAIYSKTDGVVHWSSCLEYDGECAENVEVVGSHTGMAMNPLVFHVVADRLAQPEGSWRPFQRLRGYLGLWFPEPESTRSAEPKA